MIILAREAAAEDSAPDYQVRVSARSGSGRENKNGVCILTYVVNHKTH